MREARLFFFFLSSFAPLKQKGEKTMQYPWFKGHSRHVGSGRTRRLTKAAGRPDAVRNGNVDEWRVVTRDAEAVDCSAAFAASAFPLPLPLRCSYFTGSLPAHECGSGWPKGLLPLPLLRPCLIHGGLVTPVIGT